LVGTDSSPYVGIDWEGRIVPLLDITGAIACTGVSVDTTHLITAAHCLPEISTAVLLGKTCPLEATAVDSDMDVAVLALLECPELRPIRIARLESLALQAGSLVEIAGFGRSEAPSGFVPRFAVLSVAELSAYIVTDAEGYAGGCFGDSGAPLLTRDNEGSLVIVGMLASGSASCLEHDRSVRSDVLQSVVDGALALDTISEPDCAQLPSTGRCFDNVVVRCSSGFPSGEVCSEGRLCGWNLAEGSYGCVSPTLDPCHGVSEFGDCTASVGRRCVNGELSTADCSDCGEICVRSPRSGAVSCTL
jgi:hypothetical protein